MDEHVIGIDFGTDSVRSVVVNATTGEEVALAVFDYPRWAEGLYCEPRETRFRHHPLDYVEGLEFTVKDALGQCPRGVAQAVKGISAATTGSTTGAVDRAGASLGMRPGLEHNPNAMFVIWKDHTGVAEAEEINHAARTWGGEDFTKYEGGVYSAEWFWSKILHVLRADEEVRGAAYSWVELCDWIPALLTGNADALTIKRSRCAAGHKAMWHPSFGGLPPEEFLAGIDPLLAGVRANLCTETLTSDKSSGLLCREWAERLGLRPDTVVGVGAFDAHMGAVGGGIVPYALTKVIGTSTCDIMVSPMKEMEGTLVRGICGQVEGSVIPGMLGMEAGQSAFGDVYAWFKQLLMWPLVSSRLAEGSERGGLVDGISDRLMDRLMVEAGERPVGSSRVVALDWLNGRRTPDADQKLKGAIIGLSLGVDAPDIFKSLVEATAFGAKAIVERFILEGVPVKEVIALGGVPRRAPYIMQTLADVFGMPVKVAASEQTCALGAAMFAATAGGIYGDVSKAQQAMGCGFDMEFRPRPENSKRYVELYELYHRLSGFMESMKER